MTSRQAIYSGRVQGVGFRMAVKRIASGYDVTGWVRNLDDGRVEMQVMSEEEDELQDFLTAVDESDLAALIRDRELHIIAPLVGVRGFSIVR